MALSHAAHSPGREVTIVVTKFDLVPHNNKLQALVRQRAVKERKKAAVSQLSHID